LNVDRLAVALWAWAVLAPCAAFAQSKPAPVVDWLDLRRKGPAAILAAARTADAREPRIATYAAKLPPTDPLHGLRVTVARAPGKTAGKLLVRFDGPKSLQSSGFASDDATVWLRLPGQKAGPLQAQDLFAPLPALPVPLAVLAAPAITERFEVQVEGEFDDVAVLRMRPRYEQGPGLVPMKLGVSKRWQCAVVAETTDLATGRALASLLWLDTRQDGCVHDRLRLRGADGRTVDLALVALRRGKDVGKLRFDAAALN
jgi:hypothetical protein